MSATEEPRVVPWVEPPTTTLLDYPGKVGALLFTRGCNLRCPFCHNPELFEGEGPACRAEEVDASLARRQGFCEGVVVTGGEPLLHAGLKDSLARWKELGYLIKLDTNGSFPDRLAPLLEGGLVDRVALDIKALPGRYDEACGGIGGVVLRVGETLDLLRSWGGDWEARTTLVAALVGAHEGAELAAFMGAVPLWAGQAYVGRNAWHPDWREKAGLNREEAKQVGQTLLERGCARAIELRGFE